MFLVTEGLKTHLKEGKKPSKKEKKKEKELDAYFTSSSGQECLPGVCAWKSRRLRSQTALPLLGAGGGACRFKDPPATASRPQEERGSPASRGRVQGGAARLPGDVLIDGGTSVQEDDDADHGRGDEHLGVHAQPGEVQANLLPKVLPAPQGKAKQRQAYAHCKPVRDVRHLPDRQGAARTGPRLLPSGTESGWGLWTQPSGAGCPLPFCTPGRWAILFVRPGPGDGGWSRWAAWEVVCSVPSPRSV